LESVQVGRAQFDWHATSVRIGKVASGRRRG
jgi:hypothetical protein